MLRETSRLTTVCQNEDKINSARGPVMREALCDRLSKDSVALTNVDQWSSNKKQMHLTRSEAKVDFFCINW